MSDGAFATLVAAILALVSTALIKLVDIWVGRSADWRAEALSIRKKLEDCEDNSQRLERQSNQFLVRISHLEFQLSLATEKIEALTARLATQEKRKFPSPE